MTEHQRPEVGRRTWAREGRAEAIYRATLAIATELSVDAVLQKIVDASRELVEARFAALGVVDEEQRRLVQFVVSGVAHKQKELMGHWPYGLGLIGELIHFPRPLRVKDISKDPRSIGFPPHHPPMKSFLGVPILRDERVLGNLYMADKVGAEEFSEEDEEILSLFAVHAAIAIENARLYTQTDAQLREKVVRVGRAEKRARFLSDLGALLLQLPPGEELPLETIANQATEPLADTVGIVLVAQGNPSSITSRFVFHQIPERREAAERLVGRSWKELAAQVIGRKRSVLTGRPGLDAETPVFDPGALEEGRFSSALAVPVATRQTTHGLLYSLASRPASLTAEDLAFAKLIADRLGSTLEGASQYRQQLEARAKVQELADLAQHHASELETILDTMTEAVYVADPEGRLRRLNQAFARLVGLADKGQAGGSFAELMGQLHPENEVEAPVPDDLPMARALKGESFTNHMIRITTLGGANRVLSVSGAPIRDASGRIVAAVNVARDVTELREIDRLKDEFISVASHEMRTPLTVIKGYAQILERRLKSSDSTKGLLDMARQILNQTQLLSSLTDRLLDMSRVQFGRLSLEKEKVDLAALVRDVAERMRVATGHHTIRVDANQPVFAEADASRLEQVLMNLISNAVKYSPEGTAIDISLEQHDGDALVSVRDRGHGIPADRQDRIFQRFYRAVANGTNKGLGLGLYVSKGIVEAHGGKIWFESKEGKGSTFYVRLPAE